MLNRPIVKNLFCMESTAPAPAADRAVSELSAALDRFQSACVDEGAATMRQARDELEAAIRAQAAPPADRAELAAEAKRLLKALPAGALRPTLDRLVEPIIDAIDALARSTDAPSEPAEANRRWLGALLTKMPTLNPAWPADVREGWQRCFDTFHALAASQAPAVPATDPLEGAPIDSRWYIGAATPTHRHIKRGTLYVELGRGTLQTAVPLTDMTELVAYRGENGQWWFRAPSEFDDDERFALIDPGHTPTAGNTEDARSMGAVSETLPTIRWPKERDVGRIGDMSLHAALRVGLDNDNDVYVAAMGVDYSNALEFCNPGANGGGQSRRTRMALIALMVAIEEDNAENPSRDFWARRAAPSTRADNQTKE